MPEKVDTSIFLWSNSDRLRPIPLEQVSAQCYAVNLYWLMCFDSRCYKHCSDTLCIEYDYVSQRLAHKSPKQCAKAKHWSWQNQQCKITSVAVILFPQY